MKYFILLSMLFHSLAIDASPMPTPPEALEMLMHGNQHFVEGNITHLSYATEAREKLVEGQTPFAAIVGCSDSRVPPELIFDRGLGELFVVRDAGNVVGPIEIDSIGFAVEKLKVPLVMVIGHQNCGAVKATYEAKGKNPNLGSIFPLIDKALKDCQTSGECALINAIYCNVKNSVENLKKSPAIASLLSKKKVMVVGAYFDIESGKVNLIAD